MFSKITFEEKNQKLIITFLLNILIFNLFYSSYFDHIFFGILTQSFSYLSKNIVTAQLQPKNEVGVTT
jgi:flagellar biosynthesis protein FliR